jgi:hypothetical protein
MAQIKHECNLLRCKTKEEAVAEVTWHFARRYFIEEKYKNKDKVFERL